MRTRGRTWLPLFPAPVAVEGGRRKRNCRCPSPTAAPRAVARAFPPTITVTPEATRRDSTAGSGTTWLLVATGSGGWFGGQLHEPWVGAVSGSGCGWYLWACCWYPDKRPGSLLRRVRRRRRQPCPGQKRLDRNHDQTPGSTPRSFRRGDRARGIIGGMATGPQVPWLPPTMGHIAISARSMSAATLTVRAADGAPASDLPSVVIVTPDVPPRLRKRQRRPVGS